MIHSISAGAAHTIGRSTPSNAQDDSFQQLLKKAINQTQPEKHLPQRQAAALADDTRSLSSAAEQYRTVNGIEVIVAGHSLDSEKPGGLSWDTDMPIFSDPEAVERQLAAHPEYYNNDQYRLTQISVEPLGAPLERLHSIGMSDGLFTLPSDQLERSSQLRSYMADLTDQLVIERELQQTYGKTVKLAYSPAEGAYIMLKPGDGRYDEVSTGQYALANLRDTFALGNISDQDKRMVREMLAGEGFYL